MGSAAAHALLLTVSEIGCNSCGGGESSSTMVSVADAVPSVALTGTLNESVSVSLLSVSASLRMPTPNRRVVAPGKKVSVPLLAS